jgi:hypothetical protein
MIEINALEHAWRWFEEHSEEVFDSLEIPNDTDAERMFRHEAAIRILRNLKMERGPCGRYMEQGLFREEMGRLLRSAGYKRPAGEDRFSIKSLKSAACLDLTWQFSLQMARGYARWKTDMDPDILEASPCYELIRVRSKVEIRDWPLVWEEAGGTFHGTPGPDYPGAPGRMIALKTDPIWLVISRFKTPWPPFQPDSGMGLRSVRWKEAEALGLIKKHPLRKPLSVWWDLNHDQV